MPAASLRGLDLGGSGVVAQHGCARRGGSSDSGPPPGAVAHHASSPCSRAGSTLDPARTADRPARRPHSPGSETADRKLAPTLPQHWTAPGEAGIKEPAAKPLRRTATPGARGRVVSEPGPSLYRADKHIESVRHGRAGADGHKHAIKEISTRRRQPRSAAARPQDAAVDGGAGCLPGRDADVSIEAATPCGLGLTPSAPLRLTSQNFFAPYTVVRASGLLLASNSGLILDSASAYGPFLISQSLDCIELHSGKKRTFRGDPAFTLANAFLLATRSVTRHHHVRCRTCTKERGLRYYAGLT